MPSSILNGLRRPALLTDANRKQPGFNGGEADVPVDIQLEGFQQGMQGELRDRAFQARRLGDTNEVAALTGLMSSYAADRAASPLRLQEAQTNRYMDAQQGARLAGFGTSGEQAQWGRDMERRKLEMPLREREIARDTAIRQAEIQAQAGQERERIKQRANFDQLSQILSGGGANPGSAVSRVGVAGGPNVSFRQAPAQRGPGDAMFRELSTAQDALAANPNDPAVRAYLGQARQNLLSKLPYDEGIKGVIGSILDDPELENFEVEDIVNFYSQNAPDEPPFSAQELADMETMLRLLRRR